MVSTILRRPWCWLTEHRWGPVARYITFSFAPGKTKTQHYCRRCGKAMWRGE